MELLQLSDEILLIILSFLGQEDLFKNVAPASKRLWSLTKESKLSRRVEISKYWKYWRTPETLRTSHTYQQKSLLDMIANNKHLKTIVFKKGEQFPSFFANLVLKKCKGLVGIELVDLTIANSCGHILAPSLLLHKETLKTFKMIRVKFWAQDLEYLTSELATIGVKPELSLKMLST
jgi:hypothetical protein